MNFVNYKMSIIVNLIVYKFIFLKKNKEKYFYNNKL